ncbi:MAG: ABC transporter ATP-binding protein [Chloroflexi bacterium]|nr:ABC transporter ATP-binding protein [Chloroflexota bacterium]
MNGAMITLENVVVVRGKKAVLTVDRLDLRKSETLAVIGPNGSGKSTLLLAMALLLHPARGTITFDGQTVPDSGAPLDLRRRVAVVFQTPLLADTTVQKNVAMGLKFRRMSRDEAVARANKWMERLGVHLLRDRQARTLSGGEAQRVSLARALAIEPDVLLLDEPLASLDAPTRAELLEDLERILRESSITAVFVTHDRNEALALGERIAVLIGGNICQIGTPDEVFNTPANEEVASFVGVETMVPGVVESQFEGLSVVRTSGVDVQVVGDYRPGDQVMVLLRPEDVVLSLREGPPPSSSMRNNLPGVITKLSTAGSQYKVVVDCGFPLVSLITKQSRLDMELAPGTPVRASFKASAAHVIRRTERPQGSGCAPPPEEQQSAAKLH